MPAAEASGWTLSVTRVKQNGKMVKFNSQLSSGVAMRSRRERKKRREKGSDDGSSPHADGGGKLIYVRESK